MIRTTKSTVLVEVLVVKCAVQWSTSHQLVARVASSVERLRFVFFFFSSASRWNRLWSSDLSSSVSKPKQTFTCSPVEWMKELARKQQKLKNAKCLAGERERVGWGYARSEGQLQSEKRASTCRLHLPLSGTVEKSTCSPGHRCQESWEYVHCLSTTSLRE